MMAATICGMPNTHYAFLYPISSNAPNSPFRQYGKNDCENNRHLSPSPYPHSRYRYRSFSHQEVDAISPPRESGLSLGLAVTN